MKRFTFFVVAIMTFGLLFTGFWLFIVRQDFFNFHDDKGLKHPEKTTPAIVFKNPLQRKDFQNLLDNVIKPWATEFFNRLEKGLDRVSLSDFSGVFHTPYGPADGNSKLGAIHWGDDYAQAMEQAQQQGRMLLVYFCDPSGDSNCDCDRFKSQTLDNPMLQSKLEEYVCLQAPLDASIIVDGKKVVLLEHEAFREMLGQPGIAIIDYQHLDPQLYGMVVSTFPLEKKLWYTPEKMAVILDLPPGTLTQRTMIYAVRIHPDCPASTQGELSDYLLDEARSHSQYQANIRLQGHHRWQSRFHRITARLRSVTAREVCAESWPGENLVEAAVECVRCWRLSSGHWSAVSAYEPVYGYDMKRGSNGVWYATGIFGSR